MVNFRLHFFIFSSQLVQYLKPRPDELYYPDSDGSIAVHYAARCAATDKTEVLRYLSFICEAAYLKEIDNVPVSFVSCVVTFCCCCEL